MAVIRSASDFRVVMNRKASKLRSAAILAVRDIADLAVAEISRIVPRDKGELAGTIKATPPTVKGTVVSAEVIIGAGLDSPHVADTEYGNGFQVAQPFIRPGFRKAKDEAPELATRRLADSI